MLDLSHIPNSQQDIQIFYSNGVTNAWQTWNKPRKCNYVYIMCIGGGGGGASGYNATGSPGAYNPQGGASGAVTRVLYNAQQLPDRLYIQVGLGGAGGTNSNNGSPGTRSFIALQPITSAAQNIVAISGAAGAAGGLTLSPTGVNGETAATQTNATFFTLSTFISTLGVSSAGSIGQPPNITPLTSQITCPGGFGTTFANGVTSGSSILSTPYTPTITGGIATITSGSNGGNGADGVTIWKPFFSTGGAGGGAAASGSGGNGGNGGIGSGGGGGGNGSTISTNGAGGKGGDGIVIIISF